MSSDDSSDDPLVNCVGTEASDRLRSLGRAVVVLTLGPGVVLAAMAAPEHMHEGDAHHPTVVVHRHFEAHEHDQEGREFTHHDGGVIWLDQTGTCQATYRVVAPAL